MKLEEIRAYCLSKWKAYEDSPFGDIPICYRLNKKIFAQIYPDSQDYKITLKCTADAGQFYRQVYPGVVVRGYFCPPVQQPYWNTIYLDDFPDEELLNMIDHAYETVLHSFSKKVQKQIQTADECNIRCLKREEYSLLEGFLYDAIYIPEGVAAPPKEIIYQPELAVYIEDFG
ncbi:MAG: MmcQ/YjbR family DNA-binding protein, partial [Lachnospiraceae bacterium]|nr:MmcQ/YjbR family DNA-binding protein [Lachnospiraceae bacterium]